METLFRVEHIKHLLCFKNMTTRVYASFWLLEIFMNFRCKSICSCSCIMHMVNLKFDFNHLTVQKWIRNTKILHSNSLISLLIRSGTSRAIGMNSGYHAPMADYLLLIWNRFIFSLWYIALQLWTNIDQYIYIQQSTSTNTWNWCKQIEKQLAFTFVSMVCR